MTLSVGVRRVLDVETIELPQTFADAEVTLARSLPGYESRPQQQALAREVELAMETKTHLLGQAGCGTGKSFGYLIPLILRAVNTGERGVASTATKALQDQVANGDLPFLQEHLGVPFTFALLKGRSNYICLSRMEDPEVVTEVQIGRYAQRITDHEQAVRDFDGEGDYPEFLGERDDFGFEIADPEWRKLTVSSEECPGKKECPYGDRCYAEKAKKKALESDIVVVNHALYFTDMVVKAVSNGRSNMIGDHATVVFDEGHEIEEYASGIFGSQFTEAGVRKLTGDLKRFASRYYGGHDELESAANRVNDGMRLLWDAFAALLNPEDAKKATTIRISPAHLEGAEEEFVEMALSLTDLAHLMEGIDPEQVPPALQNDCRAAKKRLLTRAVNMSVRFTDLVAAPFEEMVRWIEEDETNRGEKRVIIRTAPVNVATVLRPMLFSVAEGKPQVTAIVLSATLMVDGRFDYIAGRLGCDDHLSIDVGTPFDFQTQSLLFVPRNLPVPAGDTQQSWSSASISMTSRLVEASDGRALLLFSSRRQMEKSYEILSETLGYNCMKQGQRANKLLAGEFAEDIHSVLFATRSFFTGVDFQGDACSLVVMDKLPFPVPTEPLFQARSEAVEKTGGDSFMDLTVPVMSLVLQQGHGRLIRHRNDRGVVAILDPRLVTKGYGGVIVRSLPDSPLTSRIEDVEQFFIDRQEVVPVK